MIRLSACIITYNEEKNIQRCIESLVGVVDEVLVVDSFSKDQTVQMVERLGAKVIQRAFTGYGDQKLFAQQQAANQWILSIDADEVVSDELKGSILAMKRNPDYHAYSFNRLTNYCGKWIRHCGWYPDPVVRLYDSEKASMVQNKVHEGVVMNNRGQATGHLKGDLLHYSYNTIGDHVNKMQLYTELGARADVENGKKVSLMKLVLGPKWQFFVDFVLRRGFLDGYYGYIVCKNSAIASYIKYSKIRQYTSLKERGLDF